MLKKMNKKAKGKHDNQKRIETLILLKRGLSQQWVEKELKISKQKVSYWVHHPISPQKRNTKWNEKEIDEIVQMATDITTSEIASRRIASVMNEKFKNEGKELKINKSTINRYLKNRKVKKMKIKKIFALNYKQKKKELIFAKKL